MFKEEAESGGESVLFILLAHQCVGGKSAPEFKTLFKKQIKHRLVFASCDEDGGEHASHCEGWKSRLSKLHDRGHQHWQHQVSGRRRSVFVMKVLYTVHSTFFNACGTM
jgi:hypothetical protein